MLEPVPNAQCDVGLGAVTDDDENEDATYVNIIQF